jgi:hypothetical protein
MMNCVETEYGLREKVYLRLREDRTPGFISGVVIKTDGVSYFVSWPDTRTETLHYEFELCRNFDPEWST